MFHRIRKIVIVTTTTTSLLGINRLIFIEDAVFSTRYELNNEVQYIQFRLSSVF